MSTEPTTAPITSTVVDGRAGVTVVAGGTGKTGRRVADRLEAAGVPVRRASRSTVPQLDWDDPSTWEPVLDGATAVYVAYAPDLAIPGAPETVTRFARSARPAGVDRLVLLTGRGEVEAQRAEDMVAEVFPARTVLRCAFFAQNFSESFLREPMLDGGLALPVGDVGEPFVDLEDVAEVAVAALTDDRHAGRIYELTGPRLLSFADAVSVISAASGRDVHFAPIVMGEFTAGLAAAGLPGEEIDLLRYLFTEVLDGRGAFVTDDVTRVLGRPAGDFRAFAAREAASWRRAS
ncbi:NAD(P)H-binding protein [Isoptericola sediminis]|uniref:NAD(P)H-binding protein n=1 Tax=Isoptericola sediminis TaxID=2733572 RepID=A0A849JXL5_9MICO|nr:NAD(P)H-binding protein [Isoptericola sediminis]NNU27324.1 NAD(P)H-binding protein [Isoptericola sediminis]